MVMDSECDDNSVFLSGVERDGFLELFGGVDWCDEDSVFDFAVECCRLSVRLRAEVLRRGE